MSRISDALRAARIAAGITQQELADLLGVTQAFVSHMEVGRRALPVERYAALPGLIRDAVIDAAKGELRDQLLRLDSIGKEPQDAGADC